MGLIRALTGAAGSVLADSWREYFYSDALAADVLLAKGMKRQTGRGVNTKGSDNVITNGSIIAVADGQCMILVDQGKVTELCAEPGEFLYDSGTEASVMYGGLGQGILNSFRLIGKRFTFGGETPKDQRVYYINTKEIPGNKYGTAAPVPFRVVDRNIGLDIDISIRCNGEYSYKIADPILFYTNVSGNVAAEYKRGEIDSMLKTELLTALQPAFARISEMGVRYSALPGHTVEITEALNEVLSRKWRELRGITVFSFGINSVTASKEDEDMIKQLQKAAVMRDPNMAAAQLVGAQADAMRAAAGNESGAMMGFMGLGMAQQAGGANAAQLFQMNQPPPSHGGFPQQGGFTPSPMPQPPQIRQDGWQCACGVVSYGRFCHECGQPRPAAAQNQSCMSDSNGWPCACGEMNQGRFCHECGSARPAPLKSRCDKCGWTPADPASPSRFCPECGERFTV